MSRTTKPKKLNVVEASLGYWWGVAEALPGDIPYRMIQQGLGKTDRLVLPVLYRAFQLLG